MPIVMLPASARIIIPATNVMPAVNDQNKNAISKGSLIAVRKRTIDNAPTIPNDKTTLEVTAKITTVVIIVIAIKVTPKLDEYITPVNVFLYTKKINTPPGNHKNGHKRWGSLAKRHLAIKKNS